MGTSTPQDGGALQNLITPVKTGNIFEEAVEKIVSIISVGAVLPGEKLPSERDLSKLLGVSRTTIREALVELQRLKIIQIQRGRYGGAFVLTTHLPASNRPSPSNTFLSEITAYRSIIECAAAKYAASAPLTAEQRKQLKQALQDVNEASDENYRSLDGRLHLLIAQLANISPLTQQAIEVRTQLNELLGQFPLIKSNIKNTVEQHTQIVAAILEGDSEAAEKAMHEHVLGTSSLIRALAHPPHNQ